MRPDGPWTALAADAAAALAERRGVLVHATVAERDDDALAALFGAGFVVSRREALIAFEVATALEALAGAELPAGVETSSAADVDEDALRLLDDELRQDVPGTAGWRSTPEELSAKPSRAASTRHGDVVAVGAGPLSSGSVRNWIKGRLRLGRVGVRREHVEPYPGWVLVVRAGGDGP